MLWSHLSFLRMDQRLSEQATVGQFMPVLIGFYWVRTTVTFIFCEINYTLILVLGRM
jgi:hypothetical protein